VRPADYPQTFSQAAKTRRLLAIETSGRGHSVHPLLHHKKNCPATPPCVIVTAFRFITQLIIVLLTGWLLAYWPASIMHKTSGVFWLSLAAGIMLVSGICGLVLVNLFKLQNSTAEAFLHSGNRSLWVLVAVILTKTLRPQLGFSEFYGWLIFFYLQLMVLEVLVLQPQLLKSK